MSQSSPAAPSARAAASRSSKLRNLSASFEKVREAIVGMGALERLRQRGEGVGIDQGGERRQPDLALLVRQGPPQQGLRRGGVLLDQGSDGPLAEVGIARAERCFEELQPLGLLDR